MGQGQEVHARRLMAQGMANGGWLLLQNCHLSLDYVEEVLDLMIETETIHQEFRLWVTTEVHKKFPINFLQVKKILRCSQTLQMFLWFFVLCKHFHSSICDYLGIFDTCTFLRIFINFHA